MAKNSGKYLENLADTHLKTVSFPGFKYRRLHDSYAARNYLIAQPADFFMSNQGLTKHLECKSQKGTTLRLKSFSQHPEMLEWAKAGVPGFVLVHFYELPTDVFYVVDVTTLELGQPSWVIKEAPCFDTIAKAVNYVTAR